jgi:hypothetical protein
MAAQGARQGGSTQNTAGCECKSTTLNGKYACGLFKDGIRRFSTQIANGTTCDANFCKSRWAYDPYVRSNCSSID